MSMCIFISAILNLSLRGLKLEMASSVKRTCLASNGQTNLRGCFHERKKDVLQHVFLELDVKPTFCWFSSTNEYHMKTSLINGCLSSVAVAAWLLVRALFAN